MKTQVRLNLYEREIVNALVHEHHLKSDNARQLVIDYIKPIRKLGGYDSCQTHAERLVRAQEIGYSSDDWLKRITAIEHEELQDRIDSGREHPPEYAQ